MHIGNPFGVFGKKEQKSDPQAKATSTHQQAAFEAVLNHASERDDGSSARSTLGQLKQVEAVDLQQQEKQLVMKQINDRLQSSETAGKPALAAAAPASVLPAQMMKASA